jgi:uncharacterized protein (TIGR03083 family)
LFTPRITSSVLTEALQDSSGRFASLVRSSASLRTPAIGDWDTGEVAAHIAHVTELDCAIARGEGSTVEDHLRLGDSWARMLADDPERNPWVLAERIERSANELRDLLTSADLDREVEWHGGIPISMGALGAGLVNEFQIHGLDVARAIERPWTYPQPHALIAIEGLLSLAPYYLDGERSSGFHATYEVRPRGGESAYVRIDDGDASVHPEPPAPVDCRLSIDPVTYVLVAFGRRSTWGAIGAGKVIAWGRRPWLGLKFASMFIPT